MGGGWGTEGHSSSAQHLNSFFTMSNRGKAAEQHVPLRPFLMVNMSALSACSHWLARKGYPLGLPLTACAHWAQPDWASPRAWSAGPIEWTGNPGSLAGAGPEAFMLVFSL